MKKKQSYLTYALGFITIILAVFGLSLLASTLLFAFDIREIHLFDMGTISLKAGAADSPAWLTVLSLMSGYVILFVLGCVRQFFKNIIEEQIFIAQNVKLANAIALALFITAFLGEGVFTVNGYSFFNVTFIVTALVVWTIGQILEKANAIAEENEFTI